MPERVLANPLSGAEVIKAIQDQLGRRLEKDCFLSPNLAYDTFECTVTVSLKCHDVGRVAEVNVTETVKAQGEMVDSEDIHLEQSKAEFQMDPAAPNEVRVETGQPVPVLGKGDNGKPEIKQVRYSKKVAAKAAE